jgi:hypothetical protein
MNQPIARAYTFTGAINAYSLYHLSRKLGVDVRIISNLRNYFNLPTSTEIDGYGWLLFTEEANLIKSLKEQLQGRFYPSDFDLKLLDDKFAFVCWVENNVTDIVGLKQWFITDSEICEYPCLLKSKHSWDESVKLPRGWVCYNKQELQSALMKLTKYNEWNNKFFIQRWVGDKSCRVISVCGFYDYSRNVRNLTAVVERISSYTKGLSCSSAIETITDEWGLKNKAYNILNALKFVGPYELEFIISDGAVFFLEINPRFWMQHAIFSVASNGLLKRYYNLESNDDLRFNTVEKVSWFDGVYFVRRIIKFDFSLLCLFLSRFFRKGWVTILCPSLLDSILSLIRRSIFTISDKFKHKVLQ